MKNEESTSDHLMDALLKEDAKSGADEALLAEVEKRIDAASEVSGERAGARTGSSRWSWGIAAAACVGVGIGVYAYQNREIGMGRTAARSDASYQPEMRKYALLREGEERSQVLGDSARIPGKDDARPAQLSPLVAKVDPQELRRGGTKPTEPPSNSQLTLAQNETKPVARVRLTPTPMPPAIAGKNIAGGLHSGPVKGDKYGRYRGSTRAKPGLERPLSDEVAVDFDRNQAGLDRERYGQLVDQPWKTPWQDPLSTFSVDVDTASYTNIRRMLRSGATIPKDAVRLEECINYFDYRYEAPKAGGPFAVHVEMASAPWNEAHHLVKIGLKGKEVGTNNRPPSNLVFLIDVSGSMRSGDKLPLLVDSMKVLVEELDERDSVGIVVYAGSAGTILEPTKVVGDGRVEIMSALDHLRAGGSTAGAAGIKGAYELAAKHYNKDGVNRVILATDGDFNVGTSSTGALVDLVKEKAKSGVFLSVLGFGTGNVNDAMMEAITNDGNGNYFYIDSQREGRKVFLQNLSGTLVTIAKDVKIQVEFNPGKVNGYRLIGYANRILPPEAFNDDKVDAGDIGAGHTVTALYEVVPKGVEMPAIGGVDALKYQKPKTRVAADSPEWMTVKLRYKKPDGDKSSLIEVPVNADPVDWKEASPAFHFAAGVALFGEKLRQSDKIDDAGWDLVADLVKRGSDHDPHGHRAEFAELVKLAGGIPQPDPAPDPAPAPAPTPAAPAIEAPPAR